MTRVGLVGIGFMGKTHFDAWPKITGAQLTALCESDAKRLSGDWSGIGGNFGAA
ncbi:MAG: gfo/Idh/MocA family oxidoreductase, partial [Armatimonadetes bacterium]|nr:gfo/Idh/MocA family oxidoreductase [Armatimonadota bacterium]